MIYLYNQDAGSQQIDLTGDDHRYIFKVKRHRVGEDIRLRNLEDGKLYTYSILSIDKKSAILLLQGSETSEVVARKNLHLGWCVIDTKSIEKVLPTLNELGVDKVSFIYCERSQKSFKVDIDRYKKILLNSSQQSGRSVEMSLDIYDSLENFLVDNQNSYLLNFSDKKITKETKIDTIVIGCEGGLTSAEIEMFDSGKIIGLDTSMVLKSESAATSVSSLILL